MLPQALDTMQRWGFEYKTVGFCWAKTTPKSDASWAPKYHLGLGYWSRQNTEMCLLGVRGKPKRIGKGVRQLIVTPRREHSRKPDQFYVSAEALVPGPYIELFSRTNRPNWSTWGNEVGKFSEAAE
jgi:N6-adenosine-specific RNA methylase IME4